MNYIIKYGIINNNIDITNIVYKKCMINKNILYIPDSEKSRTDLFTDPLFGTLKTIYIIDKSKNITTEYEYYKIYGKFPRYNI